MRALINVIVDTPFVTETDNYIYIQNILSGNIL